jgi:hypothetical protein
MSRRFHVAFVLVALVVASGCTLPGGSLTAEASPVSVENGTLDGTGYAVDESATIALNETVGINGEDREVGVKNHIETYAHTEHAGRFVVFSTPSPEVNGTPVNPFAKRSERRDVARMLGEVNNTSALTVEDRQNVTLAGQQTELVTYATTNQSGGETTPVFVHVAVAQDAGDAVVAVGVNPQSVDAGNATTRLVENVEHGGPA